MSVIRAALLTGMVLAVLSIVPLQLVSAHNQTAKCDTKQFLCTLIDEETSAFAVLDSVSMPKLNDPAWTQPKPVARTQKMTVTYRVETRGTVKSNIESFASLAAQTYADSRGWSRLGVNFQRVQSGGQFVLVLAQASQMTTFSATGCDSTYSCNVGNYVIINDDRWQGATPAWNDHGGSLRDYRHMVVNHETGHWLGHGHQFCGGAGQSAPVMQQQSINLQGCKFNPWPLVSELYSPRLGM